MTTGIEVIDWDKIEVSSRSYAWVGWYLGGMLRDRIGDDMPESSQTAMSNLMVVGCHVDAAIDTPEYEIGEKQIVDEVIGYLLDHPDSKQPAYMERCTRQTDDLRSYLDEHDSSGRSELAGGFGRFLGITTQLQKPVSAWQYSQLTRQEGRVTVDLLASLLPETVRQDPDNQPALNWMRHFIQLANVVDSYVDARRDIADGLIADPNLVRIRAGLALNAMRDVLPAVAGMRSNEITKLARTIKVKW